MLDAVPADYYTTSDLRSGRTLSAPPSARTATRPPRVIEQNKLPVEQRAGAKWRDRVLTLEERELRNRALIKDLQANRDEQDAKVAALEAHVEALQAKVLEAAVAPRAAPGPAAAPPGAAALQGVYCCDAPMTPGEALPDGAVMMKCASCARFAVYGAEPKGRARR